MASPFFLSLLLFFIIIKSSPSISTSPLLPSQISALHSLHIKTKPDPCLIPTLQCDSSTPYRHVIAFSLSNCSHSLKSLSPMSSLPTLVSLSLSDCFVKRKPTGVFLSRFSKLRELSVVRTPVNTTGAHVILRAMRRLTKVVITESNLTGVLPRKWKNFNLTSIDFSGNKLIGKIPSSVSGLESLAKLDLSMNFLDGEIPSSVGDMAMLKNLSLFGNLVSGKLPAQLPKGLVYLDLGSNRLNGTIPHFFSGMKSLKYLNLEKNNFEGIMPFNASFIEKLTVFKIGDNSNLCYNHSKFPTKVEFGIVSCDTPGFPRYLSDDTVGEAGGDSRFEDEHPRQTKDSHGPNKIVMGVAIGLSAMVFLIIFCVLLSKCCR